MGLDAYGGEGLNFPQIEPFKCEQSPASGWFKAQATVPHTCSMANVLLLMFWLPTVSQFWCFKDVHKQGLVLMVCSGLDGDTIGEKRPGSDYVRPLHLRSEFCYTSRLEGWKEREERWKGLCESKSKCFADNRGGMLRWPQQGVPVLLSASQVSAGALMALSYTISQHFMVILVQREGLNF